LIMGIWLGIVTVLGLTALAVWLPLFL